MSIGLVSRTFIIALGARQVFIGELTIGALIGISILSSMPLTILARYVRTSALLKRAAEAENILKRFMTLPREKTSGSALKAYSGGLGFKDLAFSYQGAKSPLFEGLNIQIDPGKIAGFTGYNGSGKSTLARMVAGLLEPSRGQILVDGMEMNQLSLEWWRKQIIYLPQEPGFLPATIRENIMAASPDLDNDGLNRVLYATGLRRFLDSHPQGLDLELDEGGNPLPLGIRRRLALARALTTDGQLVILDEPAEGLDVEGWKMVNRTIKSLKECRKTLLIFSGDPRLLMDADIIVDLGSKPIPEIAAKK
jgi:ATP-binding cassette, subfamily C, bacterial LapB